MKIRAIISNRCYRAPGCPKKATPAARKTKGDANGHGFMTLGHVGAIADEAARPGSCRGNNPAATSHALIPSSLLDEAQNCWMKSTNIG
jgi:hypothetical protein